MAEMNEEDGVELEVPPQMCVVGDYSFMTSSPLASTNLVPGAAVGPGSSMGRVITAKVIQPENKGTFLQTEGKVLHLLHNRPHPVFPKLRATVESQKDGTGFIVMDNFGVDLNTYILRQDGPLDLGEAKFLFRQLANAVLHCHSNNIVLRDIRLSKIFFSDSSCSSVVIADLDGSEVVRANTLLSDQKGSPAYVGPEVLSGRPYDGCAADMWSLGVVLYRLLTGFYPFQGSKPLKLFSKILKGHAGIRFPECVDKESQDLIRRLLEQNPRSRMTANELVNDSWFHASYIPTSVSLTRRRSTVSLSDFEEYRDLTDGDVDQVVPDAGSGCSHTHSDTPCSSTCSDTVSNKRKRTYYVREEGGEGEVSEFRTMKKLSTTTATTTDKFEIVYDLPGRPELGMLSS